MIDKEKIDELGYLDVQRNRGKFLTNKFNKSKSISTVDYCKGPFTIEITGTTSGHAVGVALFTF